MESKDGFNINGYLICKLIMHGKEGYIGSRDTKYVYYNEHIYIFDIDNEMQRDINNDSLVGIEIDSWLTSNEKNDRSKYDSYVVVGSIEDIVDFDYRKDVIDMYFEKYREKPDKNIYKIKPIVQI